MIKIGFWYDGFLARIPSFGVMLNRSFSGAYCWILKLKFIRSQELKSITHTSNQANLLQAIPPYPLLLHVVGGAKTFLREHA